MIITNIYSGWTIQKLLDSFELFTIGGHFIAYYYFRITILNSNSRLFPALSLSLSLSNSNFGKLVYSNYREIGIKENRSNLNYRLELARNLITVRKFENL